MRSQTESFEQRVSQVDRRVRELDGGKTQDIVCTLGPGDSATWDHADYRATLILHTAEAFPRLSLSLHTGSVTHPDALQIGFHEADVVELIAQPIAALLSGAVTG